jgi:Holliday junction resolvasome RuvABC ATP-dependent DNA helicase subunit
MFIGQKQLWIRLEYLIPKLKAGENFNLLFRAPSGYGKTKMAVMLATEIANDDEIQYELPNQNGEIYFDEFKRVNIIDEAHELKEPEYLYPYMDSGKHTILLCSNEAGELKEPLANRCIPFIFDDYSILEIEEIIRRLLNIPEEYVKEIAKNCQLNPRIAKDIICRQLNIIFERNYPQTVEDLKNIIVNVLQIENGLNREQKRYLEFLEKVERASLDLISYALHIDKKTITKEVEPYLVRTSKVRITPRGRMLW